jgi:hypothetical protein
MALAQKWGISFLEVSAAKNINVAESFHQLVKEVLWYRAKTKKTEKRRKRVVKKKSCNIM